MKYINNSVLIITYIIMADNLCMNSNVCMRVSWTFKFMSCVIYMYVYSLIPFQDITGFPNPVRALLGSQGTVDGFLINRRLGHVHKLVNTHTQMHVQILFNDIEIQLFYANLQVNLKIYTYIYIASSKGSSSCGTGMQAAHGKKTPSCYGQDALMAAPDKKYSMRCWLRLLVDVRQLKGKGGCCSYALKDVFGRVRQLF